LAEYSQQINTSTSWQIQDIRGVCDVVTLDSALQNSYAEHVLSGKALPINYSTYITQYQTITSSDSTVNVSRSASRLKSVFIDFDGAHANTGPADLFHRSFNTFKSAMSDADYSGAIYDFSKELQWQLQIGSNIFPEYPCRSLAETFYQLKKSLGIHGSAFHSVAISGYQNLNDKFIIGVDTEKILEAGLTGLNTKRGDLMVLRGKSANSTSSSTWASSVFIILHADNIFAICDTGTQVFD